MRIAVISMVRNESDIIDTWLRHHMALFDDVFIADHLSDDGTYEYLKTVADSDPRLRLVRYEAPSYDQDLVFQVLRQQAVESCEAELFFVLDADEFLPFNTAEAFRAALSAVAEHNLLLFPWRNCFPAVEGQLGSSFDGHAALELSTYGKVAMRRHIAEDPLYRLPKGAHWLEHSMLGIVEGSEAGELLHFPIRSMDQVWKKVLQGCEAYLAVPGYDGLEGVHWIDLLESLVGGADNWEFAPALVHKYGLTRTRELMSEAAHGFEPRHFELIDDPIETDAGQENVTLSSKSALLEDHSARAQVLLAKLRRLRSSEDGHAPGSFTSIIDGRIHHPCDLAAKRFVRLPELETQPPTFTSVTDALDSAFREIEYLPLSAWGEHIPFLFGLIALMRPRRYVELGVHNGASFFAACQALRHENIDGECIAIDNWRGDEHAGRHSPEVFNEFLRHLLDTYGEFAGFIRKNFDEAAEQFEDGAIDLLHIDGFHTVGAVRNDFDHWLAKLSDRGVVIFHDINEFKADFGVWRFWRLIREKYPFAEFGHGHGLGVLVVGEKSPLRQVLVDSQQSLLTPRVNELLQVVFANLGRTAWTARREHRDLIAVRDRQIGEMERNSAEMQMRNEKLLTEMSSAAEASALAIASVLAQEIADRKRRVDELESEAMRLGQEASLLRARLSRYDKSIYGRIRRAIRHAKRRVVGAPKPEV